MRRKSYPDEVQTQSISCQKRALSPQLSPVLCLGVVPKSSTGGEPATKRWLRFLWVKEKVHNPTALCSSLLNKSFDCRSDISEGTWLHCERKVHPLPPSSILRRQYAGESSKPVYWKLRNALLCSPGLGASVLQRHLDTPLAPMPLAAFHAQRCQLHSCAPCTPGSGNLDVSVTMVSHHKAGVSKLRAG